MAVDEGRTSLWQLVCESVAAWERERLFVIALDARQHVRAVAEIPQTDVTAARLRQAFEAVRFEQVPMLAALHYRLHLNAGSAKGDAIVARRLLRATYELGIGLLEYAVFCRGRWMLPGDRLALDAPTWRKRRGQRR